jgi:hypothetical protein
MAVRGAFAQACGSTPVARKTACCSVSSTAYYPPTQVRMGLCPLLKQAFGYPSCLPRLLYIPVAALRPLRSTQPSRHSSRRDPRRTPPLTANGGACVPSEGRERSLASTTFLPASPRIPHKRQSHLPTSQIRVRRHPRLLVYLQASNPARRRDRRSIRTRSILVRLRRSRLERRRPEHALGQGIARAYGTARAHSMQGLPRATPARLWCRSGFGASTLDY